MYEFRTLSNGIRVVAEKIPYLQSAAVGVWIGNGSRHESEKEGGMSHFIEHMLFKGTEKRSAYDIAHEMDAVGGQINAFTTREYTCFYTKTLDIHTELSLDLLSDMIFSSALRKSDMDKERMVVIEEINMYKDSPEDLVYDLSARAAWNTSSLGRDILGTRESLYNINPQNMREYMYNHYTSKNMVIAVSGNYDEALFENLEKYFGSRKLSDNDPQAEDAPFCSGTTLIQAKDIEQVQLIIGFEGIDVMSDDAYSLLVFNNIFGSGMSSRLFQNIRERLGLVYAIDAGHSAYIGTGLFEVYAAMNPNNLDSVCSMIADEVKRVRRDHLSKEEVESAKRQLHGSYILSCESSGARMQGAGRSLLLNKPIRSQEEAVGLIQSVTVDSVADIIDRITDPQTLICAAVGPLESIDIKKYFN